MNPVLKVESISKSYKDNRVVSNVSFKLFAGEIFGLVGPNGAGKSTTLKMICGLTKIDYGTVLIDNFNISKNYVKAIAGVGAVIETPHMYDNLSGHANLKLYANFYGKDAVKRIPKILEVVGMAKRAKDKFGTYSLGMKQRMGIAQALINRPKLLILDEPTNGLDPSGIIELRNLLYSLAKKDKIAIIISSHNLLELEQVCDKIAFINKGQLIEYKAMSEIKQIMQNQQKICIKLDYPNYAGKLLLEEYGVDVSVVGNSVIFPLEESKIATIISFLVKNNLTIFGLNKIQKSLEEIYLDILYENGSSTSVF